MKSLRLSLWFAVVLSSLSPAASAAGEEAGFFRDLTFPAACTRAAAEKKFVFIDFYTTWCEPCKMLDRETWKDPQVIAWMNEKTVALRLDAEKETEFARRYAVRAYPTLLFLQPDGTEADRWVGYLPATRFMEAVRQLEAGKNALTRAREQVEHATTPQERIQARMGLGRELAQAGKNAEALEEFLWCFDVGMVEEPAFVGVRLSFLVSDLLRLGRTYPPALDAVNERKERAWKAFAEAAPETGPANDPARPAALRQHAMDFAALSRALKQSDELLRRYDSLPVADPRRRMLAGFLFEELLRARRYQDAAAARPVKAVLLRLEDRPRQAPTAMAERMKEAQRKMRRQQACDVVEAYAGAGQLDDARTLIDAALASDAAPEFRAELRAAAARGGHGDLVPEPPPAPAASASAAPAS